MVLLLPLLFAFLKKKSYLLNRETEEEKDVWTVLSEMFLLSRDNKLELFGTVTSYVLLRS